jgi:hypothetical protein
MYLHASNNPIYSPETYLFLDVGALRVFEDLGDLKSLNAISLLSGCHIVLDSSQNLFKVVGVAVVNIGGAPWQGSEDTENSAISTSLICCGQL